MSITASQLVSEISINGAEDAQSKLTSVGKTADTTQSQLTNVGKAAQSTGTQLTGVGKTAEEAAGKGGGGGFGVLGIAAAAAATLLVGVGIKSTMMAAEYERSMNKVKALTGASTSQMKQFDSGLKQLAMDTGVAPKALSEGLYNVISAGYQGADAMTVLSLATKDSVIGMTSATVTTNALTNVMAQFGMGAKDATVVNGEMLETVRLGKATFAEYASSVVKAAGAASQFHESMETMNASLATMTSSGITARNASTDFQASLKLMDGNIGTVSASLRKNGIAFDDAKFNAMDYGHKVVYLNAALDEANIKHLKITGTTTTATQAIHTIATHIDVYNKDLATLSDRQAMAAKTQEAWSITQQGFTVSMDRLKATMNVFLIDIGQTLLPIATLGVNKLNDAFQGIMDIGGKASQAIHDFGASLDKVGIRKLATDYSYFTSQINDLFQVIQGIGMSIFAQFQTHLVDTHTLVGFVSTVMQDLGNVFLLAGEAVRSFTKYLEGTNIPSSVMDGYEKFKTLLEDTAKVIGFGLYEAFVSAKRIYQNFLDILNLPIIQLLIDDIRKLGSTIGNTFGIIKDTALKVFNQFKTAFDDSKTAVDNFSTALSKIPGISSVPAKQIEDLKKKLQGGIKPDFGIPTNPHPNFLNLPQNAKNAKAPDAGGSAGGAGMFAGAAQITPLIDIVGKASKAFQDFGNSLTHIDMTQFAVGLYELKNALMNIFNLQWDQFKTVLKDVGKDAKQVGDWFASSVVPAIKDALPGFENLFMVILTDVIPTFIKVRSVVIDVIQHAFEKFAPIIEKIVPPLIRFAGVLANGIANGLKFIMPYVLQAAKAIGDFAKQLIDRIAPIVSQTMDKISVGVTMVMTYWNMVWPMMSGVLKGVWDGIVGIIKIAWAVITGLIKITLDIISGNWGQAWQDMQDMFKGVWEGIKTFLKGAWEIITTLLSNAWKNIQQIFAPVGQWFHDQWQKAVDAFSKVFGGIGAIATDIWNGVTGGVKTAFNGIIDLINGVISHINTIKVGGVGISIPLIPHLASGIENFMGGLALTGEEGPELINLPKGSNVLNAKGTSQIFQSMLASIKGINAVPSSGAIMPSSLSNSNNTSTTEIHNHIYIDGKELSNNTATHIVKRIRTSGPIRSNMQ